MSEALLGDTFDIHGGGLDLVFPHHENEIAQSECAHHGKQFVRFWLHNGYVTVNGEKMSKSLGNFFTVRQLLEEGYHGETIRLTLLSAHYRQPLDFSRDALKASKQTLDRFYMALREAGDIEAEKGPLPPEVVGALEDDLNTPLALSVLHECATALNKAKHVTAKAALKSALLTAGEALGLLRSDPEAWFKGEVGGDNDIENLITARNDARKAKNFAEADRIRKELEAQGIVLEDKPGGKTEWRRAG